MIRNQSKIQVVQGLPSDEAAFLFDVLKQEGMSVDLAGRGAPVVSLARVAITVGPVRVFWRRRYSILIALGPIEDHPCVPHNVIVVTSTAALQRAQQHFGHTPRYYVRPMPLLNLDSGKRRLLGTKTGLVHFSTLSERALPRTHVEHLMQAWCELGDTGKCVSLYDALQFNSLVRAGCVGVYPCQSDTQIRRHLALGGDVVCQTDDPFLDELPSCVREKNEETGATVLRPDGPLSGYNVPEGEYRDFLVNVVKAANI